MTRILGIVLAIAVALTLTACGGGGTDTPGVGSGPVTPPLAQPDRLVGAHIRTGEGRTVGIGPAFRHASPGPGDLATVTAGGTLHSGDWRDPLGRDGSAGAADLLAFVQAFQDEEDAEGGGDLIIGRPGGPKTLRIGQGASRAERATVDEALRILNTVLPWDRRLRLGTDVATPVPRAAIAADAIHLHFTDGKAAWPAPAAGDPSWDDAVLGIGAASFDPATLEPRAGEAWIDRTHPALRAGRAAPLAVVLHELLHALGIAAHVDGDQYPTSILQPYTDPAVDPVLYVTRDGAALRALPRLTPGKRVRDLTAADFGPWETTGFHLLMANTLGGANTEDLQAGLGWRNGLATPWAYGPEPDRTVAHLGATARWDGTLLGFTRSDGRTVRGEAAITADFERDNGRADFTALEAWPHRRHPGNPGTGTQWGDGDLGYTLRVWETGRLSGFDSAASPGDDPGVVTGVLVGTAHEGATGVLEHPDLAAAFGGVRE